MIDGVSTTVPAGTAEIQSGRYGNRDPVKWREYMKNYMREYRKRKREAAGINYQSCGANDVGANPPAPRASAN